MKKMNLLEAGEYLEKLSPRAVLFDSGKQGCPIFDSVVRVILDAPNIRVANDIGRIFIDDENSFVSIQGVRRIEVVEELRNKYVELFAYCDDPEGFSPDDYIKIKIMILL